MASVVGAQLRGEDFGHFGFLPTLVITTLGGMFIGALAGVLAAGVTAIISLAVSVVRGQRLKAATSSSAAL